MSDDGFMGGDSPYDDFDDAIFWNDDASQNLADDLAEHTLPSPVYNDDPAYDLAGYHSDWEYYSDDYYDDDLTLLQRDGQELEPGQEDKTGNTKGIGVASRERRGSHNKRGRKRKLADTKEIPELSLGEPEVAVSYERIKSWFKCTVWKDTNDRIKTLPYNTGNSERVALLKDWRDVFRDTDPVFKVATSAKRKSQRPKPHDPAMMSAIGLGLGIESEDENSADVPLEETEGSEQEDGSAGLEDIGSDGDSEIDVETERSSSPARKRWKRTESSAELATGSFMSNQPTPPLSITNHVEVQIPVSRITTAKKRGRGRPRKRDSDSHNTASAASSTPPTPAPAVNPPAGIRATKKRKASVIDEDMEKEEDIDPKALQSASTTKAPRSAKRATLDKRTSTTMTTTSLTTTKSRKENEKPPPARQSTTKTTTRSRRP